MAKNELVGTCIYVSTELISLMSTCPFEG